VSPPCRPEQTLAKASPGFKKAYEMAGGFEALAARLGTHVNTIRYWAHKGVPLNRVLELERLTGIPREELRPDPIWHVAPSSKAQR